VLKYQGASFTAEGSWRGPDIARLSEAVVMLRWIDTPFFWHANTGEEVFVVLSGVVDMHMRARGEASVTTLGPGDILYITEGEEHVAHPRGEARILVIEEPKPAGAAG
jgi:mannose-6-phosphate isomerase-like protein (cupin superfamily)